MAYLAGQGITTVGGQAGTLTGYRDLHGNPYVQFDSGPLYAVRRDGIKGPLAHVFGSTREAYDHSQASDAIRDGDVLFVPTEGIAAVLYGAWPVAVNEPHDVQHGEFHGYVGGADALAAADGGRYAESVQMARDLITRPADRDLAHAQAPAEPADLAAVTAAIGEINERIGYPAMYAQPCPGHMIHNYAPIEGITVTGDPYSGDRTQRLQIAGAEVGYVQTAPVTGSTAICQLPHQPGRDLRLFGCASPGSAVNGLQNHLLTEHPGPGKPTPATAAQPEFPAANPLTGRTPGAAAPRRPAAGPAARSRPAAPPQSGSGGPRI